MLEALRQPREDGVVSVARIGGRADFSPALPPRRDGQALHRLGPGGEWLSWDEVPGEEEDEPQDDEE